MVTPNLSCVMAPRAGLSIFVTPANAGVQIPAMYLGDDSFITPRSRERSLWMPAFAGMTTIARLGSHSR